ncbi:hypothetical protein [Phyllobacterium sp. YR531]|uniref:hypothetical protein n=1 Tax=Phyllobacterium sp. YR531 TaxID=1144343 RepID=UPI0012F6A61F|nr:hypothetical protein [Phyllobacterium sp. YR531]
MRLAQLWTTKFRLLVAILLPNSAILLPQMTNFLADQSHFAATLLETSFFMAKQVDSACFAKKVNRTVVSLISNRHFQFFSGAII